MSTSRLTPLKLWVGRRVTDLAGTPVGARLSHLATLVDGLLKNDSDASEVNGEHWLLRTLAPLGLGTVLDVGAYHGGWSELALAELRGASVHAFEPVPAAYDVLRRLSAQEDRLIANQLALSSPEREKLQIWLDRWDGRSSSATSALRSDGEPIVVPCETGDRYLEAAGIEHVHLLKVDAEGHEMAVLQGFAGALAAGKVDVIQFEFTLWSAVARVWLGEYYDLLEPLGYELGKLFPKRVDWKSYDPADEQFLRCNYVAVRRGSAAATALGAP